MNPGSRRYGASVWGLAALLAGCAAAPTWQPPDFSYVPQSPCYRSPLDLPALSPATPDAGRKGVLDFRANSHCLQVLEAKPLPAMRYSLEGVQTPAELLVEVMIVDDLMLAPEVAVVNAEGEVQQHLPFDDFVSRGPLFTRNIFIAAGQKAHSLLVTPDPKWRGGHVDRVQGTRQTTPWMLAAGAGVAVGAYSDGVESASSVALGNRGNVRVTLLQPAASGR